MTPRRLKRFLMWTSLAATLVLAALLVFSRTRPAFFSINSGTVVGVTLGRIEIARSDAILTRQSIAYGLGYPTGYASILVAPESSWRPSRAAAAVGLGPPATTLTLRVLYIPIWPWLTLSAFFTALFHILAGRRFLPGHCPRCNYDLTGITAGRCPECGGPGLVVRLVASVARLIRPRLLRLS